MGKGNSKGAQFLAQELLEKVQRYTRVSELRIRPNPKSSSSPRTRKVEEGKKVLNAITKSEYFVVLDERGTEITSEGMATLIADVGDEGRPLLFCIGGPFGHSDQVRQRADRMLRLSAMVLNHEVARIVLLEQLYRAWTILRGHPYHH